MEENNYGISVVIPFYKGNRYIQKAVDSLLGSLELAEIEHEIIIINDSPDIDVKLEVTVVDKVTVYKNEKNRGVAASRNIGKRLAKYKYIYFIDQDDWVDEKFFIYAFKYLNNGYDALILNFYTVKNRIAVKRYNCIFKAFFKNLSVEHIFRYGSLHKTIGQAVFTRELMSDFIETKTMGSDDSYMLMDLLGRKDEIKLRYIHKSLLYYRMHSQNFSNSADFGKSASECFETLIESNENIKEYLHYRTRRIEGKFWPKLIAKTVRIAFMLNFRMKLIKKTKTD